MGYKPFEALNENAFTGSTKWTNEANSGWTIAGNVATHAAKASHDEHVGPHLYQTLADMADSLVFNKKARIRIDINSVPSANANLHVHLVKINAGVVTMSANIMPVITQANWATIDGTWYEFTIPSDYGPAAATWGIGLYGNTNQADPVDTTDIIVNSLEVENFDDDISCVISSAQTELNGTTPIPCTVTFGEAVTGFAAGDVSAVNQDGDPLTVDNVAGGPTIYTFDVTPNGDDPEVVIMNIAAGVVARSSPADGIGNAAAAEFKRTSYSGNAADFEAIVEDLSAIEDV